MKNHVQVAAQHIAASPKQAIAITAVITTGHMIASALAFRFGYRYAAERHNEFTDGIPAETV